MEIHCTSKVWGALVLKQRLEIFCFLLNESCFMFLVVFRWYFAMISVSGAFSVTFSVIFAYIADVTDERERSTAYGLVSGSFIKY